MNPEFQRNLWLEWTRPRLTSAFAALAAVLALAWLANGRMDVFFRTHGFRLGPIPPGSTAEGFAFT
ncbi:MAG: hypothetical protein EBU07_19675, partial [Betaproteobacteria bacterium]|nr:hypothetical protein [Betaproteobacteria bacterium]